MRKRRRGVGLAALPVVGLMLVSVASPLSRVLAQTGSVQGTAFLDRNCNHLRDAGEPVLAGWKVYLRGQVGGLPPILDSAATTSDGVYLFGGLSAGDYDVSTSQQAGYVQSSPFSVDYRFTLAAGSTLTGRDFSFKAIVTCDTTITSSCLGGVNDNFSTANGSEPSAPSAGLQAALATCGTPLAFFDQPANNACFGHTFVNCWDPCGPTRATFTMRLRASSAGSQDDEIHLGGWPSPGSIWHASLSTLLELKTGGADVSWDPGDTMTLSLDLANLPVADRGITNILAALQDGNLDILLRNNTEIDYGGGGCGGG